MPETPPAIRGQLYSTHWGKRCPSYHQCRSCLMCQAYDRHSAQCQACEGAKPGGRHHECTGARREMVVLIEEKMNRPMYDVNQEASTVTIDSTANDGDQQRWDRLIQDS